MTEQQSSAEEEPNELVRTQDFETSAPIEIDIGNSSGTIRVELADTELTHVEVRHDPSAGGMDWRGGISGLLNWVTEQFGESGLRPGSVDVGRRLQSEPFAEAVRQTRIDLTGSRLAVRSPASGPLRGIPLEITIKAPLDSQLGVHTDSGKVAVSGAVSRLQLRSGSGEVIVDEVTGTASARTGSGQMRLGTMRSGVQARSGSGDVEIGALEAASSVVTGSGNVWLGEVHNDVLVRSGSGDITVADAAKGQVELITGSGELQVSIRRGVLAEVDLTSSTGSASSDLPVADEPPEEEPKLRIFGRTGNGDVLVGSAM
ncbi:DUF4097 family beta strand repeat-containing protein [Saccharopolyspora taberi]|uniref:DUF4097 family beta strand repeat-containing protein n=1 Tax=Saccharopolyspora taberi TaxID=60895 RepID=A0ABN3V8P2_9PSEU